MGRSPVNGVLQKCLKRFRVSEDNTARFGTGQRAQSVFNGAEKNENLQPNERRTKQHYGWGHCRYSSIFNTKLTTSTEQSAS
jgi:hypothetical protein